jgi:deazaflavin-dependent oxidoreductase (nitroreductase family)
MAMGPYHYLRYLVSTRGPRLTFTLHRFVYRVSGGRLFSTSGGKMPVLLLTTTGRKSGQPRTWPLNYLRDGDDLVLVASNCGRDYHAAWYLNLLARPQASAQVGRKRIAVMARVGSPEEKTRLWPVLTKLEPLYVGYEKRTTREIPLVFLTPTA